jgi:dTDP-4-dehydrorhamnose 3,5-epimerase
MIAAPTALADVLLLQPRLERDARGYFMETWNRQAFERYGVRAEFPQDGIARSRRNVLRGLHYQVKEPQVKLVHVLAGETFDDLVFPESTGVSYMISGRYAPEHESTIRQAGAPA